MEEVIVKLYAEVLLAVLFTIGYLVLLVQKRQWIQPVRLLFGIIAEKPENKQEALKCLIHIPMKKYM